MRRILSVIATLALAAVVFAIAPASSAAGTTITGRTVAIVAHRGGASLASENTLAAFASSLRVGVDQLELDVRYTLDHVLVVHHGATLGFDQCVGPYTGFRIQDLTFAQVRSEDCGRPTMHGAATTSGIQIPTLNEVFDLLATNNDRHTAVQIEIKRSPTDQSGSRAEFVRDIGTAITRHGAQRQAILTTFDWRALAAAKASRAFSGVRIMALASTGGLGLSDNSVSWYTGVRLSSAPYRGNVVAAARAIARADSLSLGLQPFLTSRVMSDARRAKMPVSIWTLNSAASINRAIDLGADAVVTDRPLLARQVLAARRIAVPARESIRSLRRAAVPDWSASPNSTVAVTGTSQRVYTSRFAATSFRDLGSRSLGTPVILTNGGRTYLIVRGADRNVWIRSTATQWSRFATASVVCPTSDPAATVASGRIYLACTARTGTVRIASAAIGSSARNPVAGGWRSLGGRVTGAPVLWTDGSGVRVGALGAGNRVIYVRTLTGGWSSRGVACGSRPDLATVSGRLVIACRSTRSAKLEVRIGGYRTLVGTVSGKPSITDAGHGQAKIFVQGTDRRLYVLLLSPNAHSRFAVVGARARVAVGGVAATQD